MRSGRKTSVERTRAIGDSFLEHQISGSTAKELKAVIGHMYVIHVVDEVSVLRFVSSGRIVKGRQLFAFLEVDRRSRNYRK